MCDTVVRVGDEGIVFAKNSDRDPSEAQAIEWHPAADHAHGTRLTCTWIDIPQVHHTNAVLISRPWWMWGAEMGTNEHGVTIGNEAVFTRTRFGDPALLGMDLLRLGLERASTAEGAAEVIISLLERYGQGGSCSQAHPSFQYHNSFLIADTNGALVLETAGKQWAVEMVSGPVRAISNGLTIPGFAQAHSDKVRSAVAQCELRRSRVEELALQARRTTDYFALLRDHGEGHAYPHYAVLNGAMSGPCVHPGGMVVASQTASSWVADLRGEPVHWVTASAAPCTSLFFPVRVGDPARLGTSPGQHPDDSMWWTHERLRQLVMHDPARGYAAIEAERTTLEDEWTASNPATVDILGQVDMVRLHWTRKVEALNLQDLRPAWVRRRADGPPAEEKAAIR